MNQSTDTSPFPVSPSGGGATAVPVLSTVDGGWSARILAPAWRMTLWSWRAHAYAAQHATSRWARGYHRGVQIAGGALIPVLYLIRVLQLAVEGRTAAGTKWRLYQTPAAMLVVDRRAGAWHVIDHVSRRPGNGAGAALRRVAIPRILKDADQANATLTTDAPTRRLADAYLHDVPGLVEAGRSLWGIPLRRPAPEPREAERRLLLTRTARLAVAVAVVSVASFTVLVFGMLTAESPAEVARRAVVMATNLAVGVGAGWQLLHVRRAQNGRDVRSKEWRSATRAPRSLVCAVAGYAGLGVLYGALLELGLPLSEPEVDAALRPLAAAAVGLLNGGLLLQLLVQGRDSVQDLRDLPPVPAALPGGPPATA